MNKNPTVGKNNQNTCEISGPIIAGFKSTQAFNFIRSSINTDAISDA